MKLAYTYDMHSNITAINDNLYTYNAGDWLKSSMTSGKFLENTPTPGMPGTKAGDILGDAGLDFPADTSASVKLDYHASSIGLDFSSGILPAIKKIQLVPDDAHQTNRLAENALEIYTSENNQSYSLIPKEQWSYNKESNGVVTIILHNAITARYLKLHVVFDERDSEYNPDDYTSFLNQLAGMLRVFQEVPVKTEVYHYNAAGNRIYLKVTLIHDENRYDSTFYDRSLKNT